ncbi:aa3-type cytochrome c oxidase subunit IV [Sphingobium rhizovicinum]|uniref:Aa3-type cytochrome c oxidase subunit IV n=1 Tax=Sphingobium rhizovicinum TaxID=432308 RepID=A0ABV7NIJ1_9SPHN
MASNGNMKAAEQTYSGFIGFVKWGTIASVAVAALVVLLISQ